MAVRASNRHLVMPALLVLTAAACLQPRAGNAESPDEPAPFVTETD